ncbi:MAG TPA: ATP-dependent DNA helicase RecQ [Polyangia bacterium]|jgi:ATP-dependent DNA helicase RecQ
MLYRSAMQVPIEETLGRFGLGQFRPGQREIIEAVLAGRPTIAVLPTGAGKSLCYQLPAVALDGLAVVVSPLISLMKDQVDALTARGIAATFINSSIGPDERAERLRAAVRGELRLVYVAPERFRAPGVAAALARAKPALLAVDEAHCMVEWGHDFRPDYARLGEVHAELGAPRIVALTATATPDVRKAIAAALGMREPAVFVRGFDRQNLQLSVEPAQGGDDKLRRVLRLLAAPEARGAPAIVYAATRKKAAEVAASLRQAGVAASAYHAGLGDEERAEVQDAWMRDEVRVVVATNAFGMGVDKRDVRLVVHHELPGSAEAYYQEAGRAGRDGLPAKCVLLFNHADVRLREFLITSSGNDGPPRPAAVVEAERERLRAMMSYAYARGCRRAFLLEYFGDETHRCGGDALPCDNCAARLGAGSAPLSDDEHLVVRKALSCVARLNGGFGRKRIALCLTGSDAREVVDAGLHRVSTFGALRGRPVAWVLDLLGAMEAAGLVEPEGDEYPCLRITAAGREVMHDRARMQAALPAERAASPQKRVRASGGNGGDGDGGDDEPIDEPLFARLRELRARLAKAEQLPAYCVFHDRTLAALARQRPATLDEMSSVPGVGPTKLAKYGAAFLDALRAPDG